MTSGKLTFGEIFMRKIFIITAFLSTATILIPLKFQVAHADTTTKNPLQEGKQWFARRTVNPDSYFVNHKNIDRAIKRFQEALEDPGSQKQAAILLLKAYYIKGTFSSLPLNRK